jgi:hypothetical protein
VLRRPHRGERVQVYDAVKRLVLLLQHDVVRLGTQVIAEVRRAGRLDAGEDALGPLNESRTQLPPPPTSAVLGPIQAPETPNSMATTAPTKTRDARAKADVACATATAIGPRCAVTYPSNAIPITQISTPRRVIEARTPARLATLIMLSGMGLDQREQKGPVRETDGRGSWRRIRLRSRQVLEKSCYHGWFSSLSGIFLHDPSPPRQRCLLYNLLPPCP